MTFLEEQLLYGGSSAFIVTNILYVLVSLAWRL